VFNLKTKKGLSLGAAPMAVLSIVFIALVAVVGVKINAQLQVGEASTSNVYLAIENSTSAIQQITSQLSLVGLILIMSIVIGTLWLSFGGLFASGRGGI
jgi:hypothetical protein